MQVLYVHVCFVSNAIEASKNTTDFVHAMRVNYTSCLCVCVCMCICPCVCVCVGGGGGGCMCMCGVSVCLSKIIIYKPVIYSSTVKMLGLYDLRISLKETNTAFLYRSWTRPQQK